MAKINFTEFAPGKRVSWKAGGKVSRLEGTAGKVVWGTIKQVNKSEQQLTVKPDHRAMPDSMFKMDASVAFQQVLALK